MPQLAVNMKVNTQNKHCCKLKIIVSKCGTQHIQTVSKAYINTGILCKKIKLFN